MPEQPVSVPVDSPSDEIPLAPDKASAAAKYGVDSLNDIYGGAGIHVRMLTDIRRVLAYQKAIMGLVANKDVLEIGCGTGILSATAAKAGARSVTALEMTEIADCAEKTFKANGVEVELIRNLSLDADFGNRKFDVIIHELIGDDPVAEGMLVILCDAAKRFLKPGGVFIPSSMDIHCLGVYSPELVRPSPAMTASIDRLKALQGVYGLNLEPFLALAEAYAESLETIETTSGKRMPTASFNVVNHQPMTTDIITNSFDFVELGCTEEIESVATGSGEATADGEINGILLSFRADMSGLSAVCTLPELPQTHWNKMVIPLAKPFSIKKGDVVFVESEVVPGHGIRFRMVANMWL